MKGQIAERCYTKRKATWQECAIRRPEERETVTSVREKRLESVATLCSAKPILVPVKINDANVEMELDLGDGVSLVSAETYWKLWSNPPLLKSRGVQLRMHTGEIIATKGQLNILVEYLSQQWTLPLIVVSGTVLTLLGRKWLSNIKLNWNAMQVNNADMISRLSLPEVGPAEAVPPETVPLLETLDSSPITASHIKQWTDHDPYLSRVRNLLSEGWPESVSDDLQLYYKRKDELSTECGCVLLYTECGCNLGNCAITQTTLLTFINCQFVVKN